MLKLKRKPFVTLINSLSWYHFRGIVSTLQDKKCRIAFMVQKTVPTIKLSPSLAIYILHQNISLYIWLRWRRIATVWWYSFELWKFGSAKLIKFTMPVLKHHVHLIFTLIYNPLHDWNGLITTQKLNNSTSFMVNNKSRSQLYTKWLFIAHLTTNIFISIFFGIQLFSTLYEEG